MSSIAIPNGDGKGGIDIQELLEEFKGTRRENVERVRNKLYDVLLDPWIVLNKKGKGGKGQGGKSNTETGEKDRGDKKPEGGNYNNGKKKKTLW